MNNPLAVFLIVAGSALVVVSFVVALALVVQWIGDLRSRRQQRDLDREWDQARWGGE